MNLVRSDMFQISKGQKLKFNPVKLPRAKAGISKDPAVPADLSTLACDDPLKKLLHLQATPLKEHFRLLHIASRDLFKT